MSRKAAPAHATTMAMGPSSDSRASSSATAPWALLRAAGAMPRKAAVVYAPTMAAIHAAVPGTGVANFQQARIKLPSNLNLSLWRKLAVDHEDPQVADLLTYGFPVSYEGPTPDPASDNHASARNHLQHVRAYVHKEVEEGALLGPFEEPPFAPWCQVNALLTRPKKDSNDRRVIMDLSWPHSPLKSVNGGTPRDTYLGRPYKLGLPSPAELCAYIRQAGPGAYLYAADVARAYRQMPLCPKD